jgi:hypothetical protein
MQPISPLLLYDTAATLNVTWNLIVSAGEDKYPPTMLVTADDCQIVARQMEAMHAELLKLNCVAAAKSTTKPAKLMEQSALTYGALKRLVEEIDGRIRDEIEVTRAFCLNHVEAAFFDPSEPLLGADVAAKFETATFDVEEAGKCHALGRSTSAVFHALRVLEVGIKALAKCLSIPDLEKPKKRNWGFILDDIKKAVELKWPTDKDRDEGDGKLFWDVYTLMAAIKVPRNGTMHPARKYTEQEADRMLRLIGDVMMGLAGRMDEKGEPKA